jgi:hypothetical protein
VLSHSIKSINFPPPTFSFVSEHYLDRIHLALGPWERPFCNARPLANSVEGA